MIRSLSDLRGYGILATDGRIGRAHDFYFDDATWRIRYVVADTGEWLPGRKVLLSPAVVGNPDWSKQVIPVGLTREDVENSPSIALDKPVSRHEEETIHEHFGWQPWWTDKTFAAPVPERIAGDVGRDRDADETDAGGTSARRDPHLRSLREVLGYHVEAEDGTAGSVHDFLVNDELWRVLGLVADTGKPLLGKKILLSVLWITRIDGGKRTVGVDLTKEEIHAGREWHPEEPANEESEKRLYDFLGRPAERG